VDMRGRAMEFRGVAGGMLVQEYDRIADDPVVQAIHLGAGH